MVRYKISDQQNYPYNSIEKISERDMWHPNTTNESRGHHKRKCSAIDGLGGTEIRQNGKKRHKKTILLDKVHQNHKPLLIKYENCFKELKITSIKKR